MLYRQLGNSSLKVSEIALGSWLTYGVGVDKSHAIACVRAAFEAGINFIDTANIYGRGAAETLLGEALTGVERSSYILATKLFFPMTATDQGLSRRQIKKQLDNSLARLKTNYVDLYQCHRYDENTPLAETMEALTDAVKSGKVRYIGFSEWPVDKIKAALAIPNVARFVSSQPQYSLLWRDPEDKVIPFCAQNGISQIVWSPLAQGILSGKYKPDAPPPADSRLANPEMNGFFHRDLLSKLVLQAIQNLVPIAREVKLTLPQLVLAWVLRQENVASAIIGATRPEQVRENAGASGHTLSADILARIDATLQPALKKTLPTL
ncbi:MAG: aldo/keto reductase family protein [Proteobacteria bacterium]|nr:aldo/keto reductase family protein [Pseudomonadota bacterium]